MKSLGEGLLDLINKTLVKNEPTTADFVFASYLKECIHDFMGQIDAHEKAMSIKRHHLGAVNDSVRVMCRNCGYTGYYL